jgi:ketosteroid isomerase-like protein
MRMQIGLCILLAILPANGSGHENVKNNTTTLESFNKKFENSILNTDHAGMLAMWAGDGVDLMPGEVPLIGKAAIAAWLKTVEKQGAGSSRVSKEELEFHDLHISGDWASEWANEHQVVQPRDRPAIEGFGKIALVLHRADDGEWYIKQEMWNDSPRR